MSSEDASLSAPDADCYSRIVAAVAGSSAFGAVVGCARAAWGSDAPAVYRARSFPALVKTAGAIASGAALFGALGGAYASGACAAEEARGVRGAWNGALGGCASGAVMGLRNGSASRGASAAAVFALASAAVDVSGRKIVSPTMAPWDRDGATPMRITHPYRS